MAIIARMNDLIIIGLEERNIERLKLGQPFHQYLNDLLGIPYTVMIYYGKTADDLHKIANEMSGPDTEVIDHTNRKKQ